MVAHLLYVVPAWGHSKQESCWVAGRQKYMAGHLFLLGGYKQAGLLGFQGEKLTMIRDY